MGQPVGLGGEGTAGPHRGPGASDLGGWYGNPTPAAERGQGGRTERARRGALAGSVSRSPGVALAVLLGWAQALINFIFRLHFIAPPYQVGAFVLGRGALLIAVATTVAYVFGSIVAAIWNWVHAR